jgi:hypothetical protein
VKIRDTTGVMIEVEITFALVDIDVFQTHLLGVLGASNVVIYATATWCKIT